MKFLHTSDWHLGRTFHNQSLLDHQKVFVNEILEIAKMEKVDGIIIAGDIYDRQIAPADAVALFNNFMKQATLELGLKLFIIPGNHDSQTRWEFGADLLKQADVYIGKFSKEMLDGVEIEIRNVRAKVFLFPYLDPLTAGQLFDSEFSTQNEIYEYISRNLNWPKDESVKKIAVSHLFAAGGLESDSEKLLAGGIDGVSLSVFNGFDYVALGHLHGFQNLKNNVFYSGTPFKYSFSECNHKKSVNLITISEKVETKRIELKTNVDLKVIEGKFAELLETAKSVPEEERFKHFYKAVLLDEKPVYQGMQRLREYYPNTVELTRKGSQRVAALLNSGKTAALKDDLKSKGYLVDLVSNFLSETQDYKVDEFDLSYINEKVDFLLNEDREVDLKGAN